MKESLNEKKPKTLGENKKNILILIKDTNALHLSDSDLEFLSGILNACKLSFSDVILMNIFSNPGLDYEKAVSMFNAKNVILFGIKSDDLNISIEMENFIIIKNKKQTLLSSPFLSEISKDKELKKQLWVSLKTMFDL